MSGHAPALVLILAATAAATATASADDPPRAEGGDAPSVASECQRMFDWIVTDTVSFHWSSAVLRTSSQPLLARLAEFTADCPDVRLRITGHTDAQGGPEYNQALSERRAAAVADYLAGLGVDRKRLVVTGAGATRPVADNDSAFGRERNRRIEITLLPPAETTASRPAGAQGAATSSGERAENNSTSNTSVESGGMGPRPDSP